MRAIPSPPPIRSTLVALLLAGLAAQTPSPLMASTANQMAEAAVEAWKRGDHRAAHPLLKRLALEGDPSAMTLLGVMAARGLAGPRNPAIAAAWYMRAAEQDHVPAIRALAAAFRRGEGVVQDEARADALEARARQLSAEPMAARR
ncbi:tetratricopeptide repeat protein [Thermaurantiacus sp.]